MANKKKRYGVFIIRNASGKIKGRRRSAYYSQTFRSVRAANEELAKPPYLECLHARYGVLPLLADEK